MHNLGYIHGDIKLENILMSTQDTFKTYLIDFGLSTKYLEPDGSHIKHSKVKKFLGNYLFCSMNTCRAY